MDTTGLGYSTQVEGESFGTKTDAPKGKPVPINANKRKGKPKFKLVCFNYLKEGHTAKYVEARLIIIFLSYQTLCINTRLILVDSMVIVMHAISLSIDLLSAGQL